VDERLLAAFVRLMRERYGARIYLFGSYARGTARPGSDYDLVAVARAFAGVHPLDRVLDRGQLWREAGGWGVPLDLHCYTPEEFRRQLQHGGYLAMARARSELWEIQPEGPSGPTGSRKAASRHVG
jgi:hypothetical protein